MTSPDLDVAIIGAGPAGLAAAWCLLADGWRIAVIDPNLPPSPRIESLPANGAALARSLGLESAMVAACVGRASAMRLYWRDIPETRTFGPDAPMLLESARLHRALRGLIPPASLLKGRVRGMLQQDDMVHLGIGGSAVTARYAIDARGRAGQRGAHVDGPSTVALAFAARLDAGVSECAILLHALPKGWLWACALRG